MEKTGCYSVRRIFADDGDILSAVAKTEALCLPDVAWSEEMLRATFASSDSFVLLGAFDGEGRLLGYVSFYENPFYAEIANVAVDAGSRRQGVATMLLTKLTARAKDKKLPEILLEVSEKNTSAIALYEGLGFIRVGERKRYYRSGESALIYSKKIAD